MGSASFGDVLAVRGLGRRVGIQRHPVAVRSARAASGERAGAALVAPEQQGAGLASPHSPSALGGHLPGVQPDVPRRWHGSGGLGRAERRPSDDGRSRGRSDVLGSGIRCANRLGPRAGTSSLLDWRGCGGLCRASQARRETGTPSSTPTPSGLPGPRALFSSVHHWRYFRSKLFCGGCCPDPLPQGRRTSGFVGSGCPVWPLGAGLALLVLAAVWRRGVAMRSDLEGLV